MIHLVPQILSFKNKSELYSFIKTHKISKKNIYDYWKMLHKEKFLTNHPTWYFANPLVQQKEYENNISKLKNNDPVKLGSWTYHSWNNTLFHLLSKNDYLNLRTIRHRNLITEKDQLILYKKNIALAGLSVGSNILNSFIRYGIGNHYSIADSDSISLSNMNRALYSLNDLGKNKTDVIANTIHTIDPYIKLKIFDKGLTISNIEDFINGAHLIIDAFDYFPLKIALRKAAKKKKIPVISGFDVEKGVLLIVERYDIEPELDIDFYLNDQNPLVLEQKSIEDKTQFFINIIGKKYHSPELIKSVLQIGKTLTGYPQLIIATFLAASTFTLAAEQVLLQKSKKSIRTFIPLMDYM
ncbi:MAG: ThiF family adenylyltransferase [bacterium]|nr:ThiF family adenylyltransferase [bacterium]